MTIRTAASLKTTLFQDGQAPGSISAGDMRDFVDSAMPPEATLTYSSTLAWDLTANPVGQVTLTGNTTITPSNGVAGQSYRLAVIQDGTGGRTVALAGCTVLGAPNWATAPNGINIVTIDIVGSTAYATVV